MGSEWTWRPDPERVAATRLGRFLRRCGFEVSTGGYAEMHRWSVEDPERFWRAAIQELGIEFQTPFSRVLDASRGPAWPRWFEGGRINAAHNCIDRWRAGRAPAVVLVWEGDDGEQRTWTLDELASEVERAAAALAECGVEAGDRVALYLPMLPETAAALVATLRLGAVAVPCFSGYGAEAVATRLADSEAKVVITADGFRRRGSAVPMKETADRAIEIGGASVRHVLVVRRLGREPGDLGWIEGRDVFWPAPDASGSASAAPEIADTAASDPALLMYTSGTTGRPKGVVATQAGFPLKIATDMAYCFDVEAGDRVLWVTDIGWVMGPWEVLGTLTLGASMVLLEGAPDYPGPDRLWQMVERHRVTHLGVSPTLVRALLEHGDTWVVKHDRSSLRVLGSTGEPWNPDPYLWFSRVVGGGRCPIINYSGGTEIGGGILGCTLLHPLAPCTFSVPILGVDADVWDESGKPVRGAVGELVVKRPWPGMTDGFWRDPKRYEETYWSRWPNTWVHGDWARVADNGLWVIEGRSDDTIKIAGKRLGPAEAESLLVAHPDVIEAAAIEVPHEKKGGALVCYVVLQKSRVPDETLRNELKALVADGLGKAMRPEAVRFARELPKTRNAKIMRRLVRAVHLEAAGGAAGQGPASALGDISSLENPSALDAIREAR